MVDHDASDGSWTRSERPCTRRLTPAVEDISVSLRGGWYGARPVVDAAVRPISQHRPVSVGGWSMAPDEVATRSRVVGAPPTSHRPADPVRVRDNVTRPVPASS